MVRHRQTAIAGCIVLLFGVEPGAIAHAAGASSGTSIKIELVREGFASFTNSLHPGNRIGYRFHEHTPLIHGPAPKATAGTVAAVDRMVQRMEQRAGCVRYVRRITEKGWVPQTWTFYMAPAEDGVDLLLLVETRDEGLNEYYGIQQCFRMSGRTNAAWRRTIALTPAFSEFDLWDREKDKRRKTSLSCVRRKGIWQPLPATTETVGCRTPLGVEIDTRRSGGNLDGMKYVGPYHARMLEPIESGLITRTDVNGEWICAIYWNGTSHVTDHHPADCLHTIVNIGGIPPNSKRAIRGRIYWFRGAKEELWRRWRRDFPTSEL